MKFPTAEEFEQRKETLQSIIKWREVPDNVIYHVKSVSFIATLSDFNNNRHELAMYAELQDEEGNEYKSWLPERLSNKLKDYTLKNKIAFIKSKGLKQSEANPERQYFDFDIMWDTC